MQFIKVLRVFSDTADIHTLKPKHGLRLHRKGSSEVFMVFRLESLLKGYKFFYQFEEPTIAALLASSSSSVIVFNFFDLYAFTKFTNKTVTPSYQNHTVITQS